MKTINVWYKDNVDQMRNQSLGKIELVEEFFRFRKGNFLSFFIGLATSLI